MTVITLILAVCIFIMLAIVLFRLFRASDDSTPQQIIELKEKVLMLESALQSRLEVLPDLINTKNADTLQQRFTIFTDNISAKNSEMIEKFGQLQNSLTTSLADHSSKTNEDLGKFKDLLKKSLNDDFEKLNTLVEDKLEKINTKVQQNLAEGFTKTNETFQNVIQRLAKIDEAQKNIDRLSVNVVSLQNVLTDKKTRGIFGEVQLNQVIYSIFSERNDKIFSVQHKLSNGNTVDLAIFTPEPLGKISVDSKFPLENYRRMVEAQSSAYEYDEAVRLFKADVKKHINDISSKYIIHNETANNAIMFLPAEAIFAEINARHGDLIEYGYSRGVWIVSPTTFSAFLSTLRIMLLNLERQKYADIMQAELGKLAKDFERYIQRWDNLSKHIDTVSKDVKDIHTTSQKITSSFEKIARVELGPQNGKEEEENGSLPEITLD